MPHKPPEIEIMLLKKLKMKSEDADHEKFCLEIEGIPTIRTKLPNHKKDIGDVLEGRIHKQLRVRKQFFRELMDCTKSREDFINQIRNDPYPPFGFLTV